MAPKALSSEPSKLQALIEILLIFFEGTLMGILLGTLCTHPYKNPFWNSFRPLERKRGPAEPAGPPSRSGMLRREDPADDGKFPWQFRL